MPKMHSLNNSQVLMPHWFTIWDDCYPWSNLNQLKRRSRRIGVFLGSHLLNNIPVAKKKVYSPTTWVRTRWKIVALQQVARFARCFWVSVAPCIGCISSHQISNKISIKKNMFIQLYLESVQQKRRPQKNLTHHSSCPFKVNPEGFPGVSPCGCRYVMALNASTGTILWSYQPDTAVWNFLPLFPDETSVIFQDWPWKLMAPVNPTWICWFWPLTKPPLGFSSGVEPFTLTWCTCQWHWGTIQYQMKRWNVKKDPVWV